MKPAKSLLVPLAALVLSASSVNASPADGSSAARSPAQASFGGWGVDYASPSSAPASAAIRPSGQASFGSWGIDFVSSPTNLPVHPSGQASFGGWGYDFLLCMQDMRDASTSWSGALFLCLVP